MQKHGNQKHAMLLEGKLNWKCKFWDTAKFLNEEKVSSAVVFNRRCNISFMLFSIYVDLRLFHYVNVNLACSNFKVCK